MCIDAIASAVASQAAGTLAGRIFGRLFPPRVIVALERTVAPGAFGPPVFSAEARDWTTLRLTVLRPGGRRVVVERAGVLLRGNARVYAEPGERTGDDLPAVLGGGREAARIGLRPSFELRCGNGDLVPFVELADGRVVRGEALRRE